MGGHKSSKKYKIKANSKRGIYNGNITDTINDLKRNFQGNFKSSSKEFKQILNLPAPQSKAGKSIKKVVITVFLFIIMSLTIGFPVTVCLGLLVLFLLLYK